MTNQDFRTLAYTKSPKTSKRTTFQDELQAAVSARASKTKPDPYSYSDDFNEDEDEFLNELLKSRKKRTEAFKAGKTKGRINDFEISDDESTNGRTKRVSFLKTQRIRSPLEDTTTSESRENELLDDLTSGHNSYNDSVSSRHSTNISKNNTQSTDPQNTSSSKSISYQTSDDVLTEVPLPLPSDSSVIETPGREFEPQSESDTTRMSLTDVAEKEPPRPKPRQRTLGLSLHTAEKLPEESESLDFSRTQTSSTSIPLSTDTSSNTAGTAEDYAVSYSLSKSSTNKSEQLFTKSTVDSGSRDGFISDDSKEQEREYSTSFEDFNVNENHSDHPDARLSQEKSFDTRPSTSQSKTTQRSQSVCSRKVESKYLGSLKVLDHKVSLQESQPQAADSLRAAVYQEWLKKKKEILRANTQQKKKEEMLKEKKKRDQEAKKEEAVASYAAWKEMKTEHLRAKTKEKQEKIRKEERAIEEKEEKRQSAKQVFEKWKHEHDQLLKEKYIKQKEAENKHKLKKQEKEEERESESKSAFSNWCEKKKNVLHEKIKMECKDIQNKAEEERYMKEERDKMALDMYEKWLVRKDLEQKRQREERRIQAILQDSPPPPWSPPNKTIPFGK